MKRDSMYMGRNTHYCQDIGSSELDPKIQHSPNEKSSKLCCGKSTNWILNLRHKIQNTPFIREEEKKTKQNMKTDTIWLHYLLYSYNNQDSCSGNKRKLKQLNWIESP